MKLSKKLLLLCLFFALGSITSCGPGIEYNSRIQTGLKKPSECSLDIFMPGDIVPPDYHRIGSINIGENMTGTSMDCGREVVLNELKKRACAEGADVVQIYEVRPPDWTSTCVRMRAHFLTYHDPKVGHSSIQQTTKRIPPSEKLPATQQGQQKYPSLQIVQIAIAPNQIPRGTNFKLKVQYLASDPDAGISVPVEFSYQILKDEKVLLKSKPEIVWGKNGTPTPITKPSMKASNNLGSYQLEVILKYRETITKETTQFTID